MTNPIVAAVAEQLDDFHRTACYPDAMPGEVDVAASRIVAEVLRLMREPSPDKAVEMVRATVRALGPDPLVLVAWRAGIDALLREIEETGR